MTRSKLAVAVSVGITLVLSSALAHNVSEQTTFQSIGPQECMKFVHGESGWHPGNAIVAWDHHSTVDYVHNRLTSRAGSIAAEVLSQESLPKDFEERARQRFAKIAEPEVTFEQYLEFDKEEFRRRRQLERDRRIRYQPAARKNLPGVPIEIPACGNGDFETALDTTKWQGAYGTVPTNGNPIFSTFTAGIVPGNSPGLITNANSRQTWVSAGTDPNVSIPRTGPNSSGQASSGAVRIGNAANGSGSELLSKTFTVKSMQIRFWYAVVFHRTLHQVHQVPSFWVRVTDLSGNVILGLVNLGNGKDKIVGDINTDPFLQIKPGLTHFYTNWSCAQISFPSRLVGKIVTVEFITEDCAAFGHYGYAYLDNFCGACPGAPH